jgi:hypothetical protein
MFTDAIYRMLLGARMVLSGKQRIGKHIKPLLSKSVLMRFRAQRMHNGHIENLYSYSN